MTKISLQFDNPSMTYWAGQVVSGRVVLDLDSEKTTTGLKIYFVGEARVHWTETHTVHSGSGRNRTSRTVTRHYTNEETYVSTKAYIFGSSGGPTLTLPPGQTTYPFSFTLPPSIPSSFQGSYGYIQYYVQSTLKRSWAFDPSVKTLLSVNGLLDLNTFTGAGNPAQIERQKHLCCLCCKSGPIGLVVRLPRTGWVPGESLAFICEILNNSSSILGPIQARIMREVSFHAKGKVRNSSKMVVGMVGPPKISSGDTEIWRNPGMRIPPGPPTNFGGCTIIGIQYVLELELEVPRGLNLVGRIPLIIGTIPFRNTFGELRSLEVNGVRDGGASELEPRPSAPPPPEIFGYPDLPPPSYVEAMGPEYFERPPDYNECEVQEDPDGTPLDPKTKGSKTSDPGEGGFVPKYVMYGWNQGQPGPPQS